jgi:K+-sensing histidine kinase KdpD
MPSTVTRERSASYRYAPELTSAREARADVSETLFRWDLGCHADEAELIFSELIANAVRHGEGPVETRISYEGSYLHMEVHDRGPGRPVWHEAGAEDESGRGLAVILGLIGTLGSISVKNDTAGVGKTVHVSIYLASQ